MILYRVLIAFGFLPAMQFPIRYVEPGDIITSDEISEDRAAIMLEQQCIEVME